MLNVKQRECKRDDLQLGDNKTLFPTSDALEQEPRCLEDDKKFGKEISLALIENFLF